MKLIDIIPYYYIKQQLDGPFRAYCLIIDIFGQKMNGDQTKTRHIIDNVLAKSSIRPLTV